MHNMKCPQTFRSMYEKQTLAHCTFSGFDRHARVCTIWVWCSFRPHQLQKCSAALLTTATAVAATSTDLQPVYAAIPIPSRSGQATSGHGGPLSRSILAMAEPHRRQHARQYVLVA